MHVFDFPGISISMTYSRIKCHTHSKKHLRNYFILFVCCYYLVSLIPIEECTLQIKSLSSKF